MAELNTSTVLTGTPSFSRRRGRSLSSLFSTPIHFVTASSFFSLSSSCSPSPSSLPFSERTSLLLESAATHNSSPSLYWSSISFALTSASLVTMVVSSVASTASDTRVLLRLSRWTGAKSSGRRCSIPSSLMSSASACSFSASLFTLTAMAPSIQRKSTSSVLLIAVEASISALNRLSRAPNADEYRALASLLASPSWCTKSINCRQLDTTLLNVTFSSSNDEAVEPASAIFVTILNSTSQQRMNSSAKLSSSFSPISVYRLATVRAQNRVRATTRTRAPPHRLRHGADSHLCPSSSMPGLSSTVCLSSRTSRTRLDRLCLSERWICLCNAKPSKKSG
mmetsp:Transcript_50559/g.130321  ORF Transcript_50559/g.130321 Transcript_50559/m.130321 type:complete len:338 (+) Transcript_50559:2248-3261(+)